MKGTLDEPRSERVVVVRHVLVHQRRRTEHRTQQAWVHGEELGAEVKCEPRHEIKKGVPRQPALVRQHEARIELRGNLVAVMQQEHERSGHRLNVRENVLERQTQIQFCPLRERRAKGGALERRRRRRRHAGAVGRRRERARWRIQAGNLQARRGAPARTGLAR